MRSRSLPAAAALLAAAGLSVAALGPRAPTQDFPRFHGEFGLVVSDLGDSMAVHWITQEVDSGAFQASVGDRVVYQTRTGESRAHVAVFRRPRGQRLTLDYGGVRNATDRDTTVISLEQPARPRDVIRGVDSVYVLSDVHGHFDAFIQLLARAGVIDGGLHWRAGRAHLVLVGDMFDRGSDATRVLWLIYQLEREARDAGGAVHLVLGNHEIMTFVGDRRYLAPKESLIAETYATCYACLYHLRTSLLGRWLATKPGMLQVNDLIFAHGGITPRYAEVGISAFNDALHRYMREPIFTQLLQDSAVVARFGIALYERRFGFFFFPDSPFWFRGYVQSDTLAAQLDSVLSRFRASTHVIGHTPVRTITPRYAGKVVPVNVADFATQLVLFVYPKQGKRRAFRIDVSGYTEEL
ncbi:MAG: metallophosphoesterase [Gemmatimonadetes bacterium]|nr:metallophosphoesterase [Gemmatimonadota bacterium]